MSVKMRQKVERKIAQAAITQLLAAGFAISVDNGEDFTPAYTDAAKIERAMFETDEDTLFVKNLKAGTKAGTSVGWVCFMYGNDGPDVIHDYTVNLEPFLTEANKLAESYS